MSSHPSAADAEQRVLIFAPIGRDSELTRDVLTDAGVSCTAFPSLASLVTTLESDGGGAVMLTEEALDEREFPGLVAELGDQPPWSDIPVLLFAGGSGSATTARAVRSIEMLRNVTLLERPIRLAAVLSTVRAALRSRARQYEVRDLLVALHRARSEAESANRLKDEFLATLSHELRTPLNAILGWTSMLARGQVQPDRMPRVFDALDRNAQAQAQLIADVLDVSRIITGKLQLRLGPVALVDVVARAIDAVRPAAAAKHIHVTLQEPSNILVHGDPDRLQQVFWNLLSNAIKFTPAAGSVRVEITQHGATIVVAVVDSGVGIPPEFAPYVFDRFRQADQTATRIHGGLGLGLSIVKHLTELHGGTVTAESGGLGQGARFEVRLPAIERVDGVATLVERSPTVQLDGRSILVVDDDEATREVVAAALELARATVVAVSSADEAKRHIAFQTPALIIADLGMPAEDGFSFIRAIRRRDSTRDVPAIALSAYADQRSQDAARAAGFNAFLPKPARAQTLLELVASLLHESLSPTNRAS